MQSLKQTSLLKSLCVKEFRRYFSSSAYVSNTIIGPIIAVIMTSSLFFADIDKLISEIPFKINVFDMFPFVISAIFCMMSPICVSISMEGKNWWIVKTLPISTKTLLDSKILMNIILYLPFYLIAEILLTIATKPDIFALLWQLLIPIIILIFAFVFSLFINLHFPVFNWESETVAVKQSLSSFIGGLGCTIAVFIAGLIVGICPSTFLPFAKLAMCIILIIATIAFYKKIIRTNLKNIN
jgi:ABC-2 type transport system permease protein